MNLQEELKALKERIAELEELAKDEQEFPKDGDTYWYINQHGIFFPDEWSDFVSERYMLEIGNVFKTREEAKFAIEKLKVEAELREFNIPFKSSYENYTLCYDHEAGELVEVNKLNSFEGAGELYFSSSKEVRNAINAIGADRIKKYIFGVED